MTPGSNRTNWLIFLLLGFVWGSSYLFIKLAVDDFGTFTLVALRLIVGSALLWTVVLVARQALPRDRRIYGHLLVMAVINITIPFLLITWAEQSVESSLAAILTSPVPLFAIVLSSIFLVDEPMRVNGVVGLVIGFIGVVIITSRGLTGTGSLSSSSSSSNNVEMPHPATRISSAIISHPIVVIPASWSYSLWVAIAASEVAAAAAI